MKVNFVPRRAELPPNALAEAELIFEGPELEGLKLSGWTVWRTRGGKMYITAPARAFGVGQKRQYFEYLRSAREHYPDTFRIKDMILAEYKKWIREVNGTHPTPTP